MDPSPIILLVPARGDPHPAATAWGVQFLLEGDRLSHSLFTEDPAGRRTVMQSVEGSASDRWPPSPALQQIAVCPSGSTQRSLACVGSAGTTHWSLAVEEDNRGCLVFDLACRVKEPFPYLGSTYEVADLAKHIEIQPTEISWTLPNGQRWFVCSDDAIRPLRWQPARRQWTVEPVRSQIDRPTTLRWKYRVGQLPAGVAPA